MDPNLFLEIHECGPCERTMQGIQGCRRCQRLSPNFGHRRCLDEVPESLLPHELLKMYARGESAVQKKPCHIPLGPRLQHNAGHPGASTLVNLAGGGGGGRWIRGGFWFKRL